MTHIEQQHAPRNSIRARSNHAVLSKRRSVQVYNGNIRLIEIAPTGPGCFSAKVNGDVLILSSRQPLLDACRHLLELGADPNSWVVMRHSGSEVESLRGKLGVLAKLAVEDDTLGQPKFRG